MRRTMPALILLATLVAPAAAQSDLPATASVLASPVPPSVSVGHAPIYADESSPYGYGTGSQLAAYMNCYPNHPNLWASYPAQRAARLDHLYYHLNGCDCLDPKRHLHPHPSVVIGKDCDNSKCDGATDVAKTKVVNRYKSEMAGEVSTLHSAPSAIETPAVGALKPIRIVRTESSFQSKLFGTASTPTATTR